MFVGSRVKGKFTKEVIFGDSATSNQVIEKSEIEIHDDSILGSKSITA